MADNSKSKTALNAMLAPYRLRKASAKALHSLYGTGISKTSQLLELGSQRLPVRIWHRNLKPVQEWEWIPPFQRVGHWCVQVS